MATSNIKKNITVLETQETVNLGNSQEAVLNLSADSFDIVSAHAEVNIIALPYVNNAIWAVKLIHVIDGVSVTGQHDVYYRYIRK